MPTTCVIEFENNPARVIYTGQILRGRVHLKLTKAKTLHGIYIKVVGSAKTHFKTHDSSKAATNKGKEEYLDERSYLVGAPNGEIELQPNEYFYSFEIFLPPDLPTSFESEFGSIRYNACVVLDYSMWPNKEFATPFTVIKSINLNADPTLREPVIAKEVATFFPFPLICCVKSGPLEMVARTPVGGYVPGQTIELNFTANNQSDRPIETFKLQLIKQINYFTKKNSWTTREEITVISEQLIQGCEINQDRTVNMCIYIPSIPPTDNITSNLIKVRYLCRVTASVDWLHRNPILNLPITIGTYPLLDEPVPQVPKTMETLPTITLTNGNAGQQLTDSASPSAPLLNPSTYPSAPIQFPFDEPPSYEEATHREGIDGDFIPKYPMFRHQTSYSQ